MFKMENLRDYSIIYNCEENLSSWNTYEAHNYVIKPGIDVTEWHENIGSNRAILIVGNFIDKRINITREEILSMAKKEFPHKIVGISENSSTQAESFETLKAEYRDNAVFLNIASNSPYPRVLLEAMASSMPVVSINEYGLNKYIKNGVNGYLTDNLSETKEILAHLLEDRRFSKKIGIHAQETIQKHFSLKKFLQDWEKCLVETTERARVSRVELTERKKILITIKDSSSGGGVATMENLAMALRKRGHDVNTVHISPKKGITHVNHIPIERTQRMTLDTLVKREKAGNSYFTRIIKPNILICDDIERLSSWECYNNTEYGTYSRGCGDLIDVVCRYVPKVILYVTGTVTAHTSDYCYPYLFKKETINKFYKIVVRSTWLFKYLQELHNYCPEKFIMTKGGNDNEGLRKKYGIAKYKNPKKEPFWVMSADRGLWCYNPYGVTLLAYLLCAKYPNVKYFKPLIKREDKGFMSGTGFSIDYAGEYGSKRGTANTGLSKDELYKKMVGSQLGFCLALDGSFPRGPNEMLNFGLPVIVSSTIDHVAEDSFLREHLVVDSGSDIFTAYKKALRLLEDGNLWNEASKACIEFAKKYTVENEVDQLIKTLEL
jgi:glycosyltransferase involved in cell wall biosynthesis